MSMTGEETDNNASSVRSDTVLNDSTLLKMNQSKYMAKYTKYINIYIDDLQ